MLRYISTFMLSLLAGVAVAEENSPETITLNYALQRAESNHPDIEQAQAAIELAESERLEAESLTGTNVAIRSRLRYVEPNSKAVNQSHDDNNIGVFVTKNLYDFGRSDAANRAANSAIKGEKISLASARNQRRLDIMRRYFDVVLADLEYLRDNEDMSTAFIALRKGQDRRELGQLSDVDILELESNYQQVRLKRYRSDNQQRSKRSLLAIAMNQLGELPAVLEDPKLPSLQRKLPEFDAVKSLVRENNPALRAAKARVDAAQARIESARASDSPILSGEFEVSESSRALGSRDDARIGLQLNIPLFTGGKTKARVVKQQAIKRSELAEYVRRQASAEQAALDVWLELNNLLAQRQQANAQLNYSELYLDQRRALYELETKSNLGNAMVLISEAQRYLKETEFSIAYHWAQLDALMGKTVYSGIVEGEK